jgi:hypothetical protein
MKKHEAGEEAFRVLVTKLGMTQETLDGEVVLRALESEDLPRETQAAIVEYLIGEYIKPTDESLEIKIKAANWLSRLACENDLVSAESYRALVMQFTGDLAKSQQTQSTGSGLNRFTSGAFLGASFSRRSDCRVAASESHAAVAIAQRRRSDRSLVALEERAAKLRGAMWTGSSSKPARRGQC